MSSSSQPKKGYVSRGTSTHDLKGDHESCATFFKLILNATKKIEKYWQEFVEEKAAQPAPLVRKIQC